MKPRERILFVDTNILLDFYRSHGEASLKLLGRLEEVKGSVVSTYQVESEFLRNRQAVMLEFLGHLGRCAQDVTVPSFLQEAATTKKLNKLLKASKQAADRLQARLVRAIEAPQTDPVFRRAMPLFRADSPYVLRRDNPRRAEIKERAETRFLLGYPPRKDRDTSMGDSFNWEWIMQCMVDGKRDVVLVSRDADYGKVIPTKGKKPILNDCLSYEIADRVGKRARVHLTDRLTHGLELMHVRVEESEKKEEESIVKAAKVSAVPVPTAADTLAVLAGINPMGAMNSAISDSLRGIEQYTKIRSLNMADLLGRDQLESIGKYMAEQQRQLDNLVKGAFPQTQAIAKALEKMQRPMD